MHKGYQLRLFQLFVNSDLRLGLVSIHSGISLCWILHTPLCIKWSWWPPLPTSLLATAYTAEWIFDDSFPHMHVNTRFF